MSALAAQSAKTAPALTDRLAPSYPPETDRKAWSIAGAIALALHAAAIAAIVSATVSNPPPVPEPVVLVELPPEAAAAPAPAQSQTQPQVRPETPLPRTLTPPVDVPAVKAPLPRDPVALPPPPPPLPARAAQSAPTPAAAPATNVLATARTGTGTGTSATPGDNAKARKQDADYYALIAAHLNRRKSYPTEAKKARQEGVVTIRFTVNREGDVSAVSVKRSSGHALLDQVTIDLLRRVAPLPRMPASMARDSVTLSLPIDYSLKTN